MIHFDCSACLVWKPAHYTLMRRLRWRPYLNCKPTCKIGITSATNIDEVFCPVIWYLSVVQKRSKTCSTLYYNFDFTLLRTWWNFNMRKTCLNCPYIQLKQLRFPFSNTPTIGLSYSESVKKFFAHISRLERGFWSSLHSFTSTIRCEKYSGTFHSALLLQYFQNFSGLSDSHLNPTSCLPCKEQN